MVLSGVYFGVMCLSSSVGRLIRVHPACLHIIEALFFGGFEFESNGAVLILASRFFLKIRILGSQ